MYDIGSVSNRNLQILYEYRILRQPSDYLSAIQRGKAIDLELGDWVISDKELENYPEVYETTLDIPIEPDSVPFLEFYPKEESSWRWLADLIGLDIQERRLILYSSSNYLKNVEIKVYWCYSLKHIESLLSDLENQLNEIENQLNSFERTILEFGGIGSYLQRPEGLLTNLVKISENELVDSLYRIETAEAERLFVNTTQEELNTMLHTYNESVEFRFVSGEKKILEAFNAPILKVSGSGNLVLKNIPSQLILTNWDGDVTIIDCSDVHIQAESESMICKIQKLRISRNSIVYLENFTHYIESVTLLLNSTIRHWRGFVKEIEWVGYGCTYWCSGYVWVPGVNYFGLDKKRNTVYNFITSSILGTFQQDNNSLLIRDGQFISFRVANSDPPVQPSEVDVSWRAEYLDVGPNPGV